MDHRKALPAGTRLSFPGMEITVGREIGRGSNAIVYEGAYADAHLDQEHRVLVKELFPLDPQGRILRDEAGRITVADEARGFMDMHRRSYESGNSVHLTLLRRYPDQLGGNLNTFAAHDTLYTVLAVSGGRTLSEELRGPALDLRRLAERMLSLLDALEAFHESGLLHLDIAPDNVMLLGKGRQERVMLIDYNSVNALSVFAGNEPVALSVKQGYTAPEIRSGRRQSIGTASDLYSVAAVFFRALTGEVLTPFQAIRPSPPDVSDVRCLRDMPDSVRAWVQEILARGLQTLPQRRYRTVQEMRDAFEELLARIEGRGITHWALWETGRRNVQRAIRENPSLNFISDEEALFPSRVALADGALIPMSGLMDRLTAPGGESAMLLGPGGMGKTTAMLRAALRQGSRYDPRSTAIAYVPLYGVPGDQPNAIVDRILHGLRFRAETTSFEDARHTLSLLLDEPLRTPAGELPVLLILLDGLNEAAGPASVLLDEIQALAKKPGVRLLLSTRTDEQALPFPRARISPLTEEDIRDALGREGLLMPESGEMQALLKTPLMLSIFLRSAGVGEKPVQVRTGDELIAAYMQALQEKVLLPLPEEDGARWQLDAAASLVLPALADAMEKQGRALTDAEQLPVVSAKWRFLRTWQMRRAFPRFIGRSAAIRGGAETAEEWYGLIVHELLWKRMGLLTRSGDAYQISHALIADWLRARHRETEKALRGLRIVQGSALAALLLLTAGAVWWLAGVLFPPLPYDSTYAEDVFSYATTGYIAAVGHNQAMQDLLDTARNDPEGYDPFHVQYTARSMSLIVRPDDWYQNMTDMIVAGGEVMPWSMKPLDTRRCDRLMFLAAERKDEYVRCEAMLTAAMADGQLSGDAELAFASALQEVLDADARIAAALYGIVCQPHRVGDMAEDSTSSEGTAYRAYLEDAASQADLRRQWANATLRDLEALDEARERAREALDSALLPD